MATVELTLNQILDAARQLSAEERRRLVTEVQRLPTPDQARDRARRLRGSYRMGRRERRRMQELLLKGNEGTLTRKESAELDQLVEDFEVRSLQLARAVTKSNGPSRSSAAAGQSH